MNKLIAATHTRLGNVMKNKFFVYQPDGDGCSEFVAFDGAFGESILDEAECVKMLNGFNSTCDANQALITKQAEQIKILRNALEIVRPDIYYNQDGEEVCAGGIFTIDENGDADNESMQQIHEALEATKPVEE